MRESECECFWVVWVAVFGVLLYVEFEKIHDSVLAIELGRPGNKIDKCGQSVGHK